MENLEEIAGDSFQRALELELRPAQGMATLRAFGHAKPWIAEIDGADKTYRYKRNFIGARSIYKGSNCASLSVALSTLIRPRLLEIQANDRGFYVMHLNPDHLVELAPIDEMTLADLLMAKEYAAALTDLEHKANVALKEKELKAQLKLKKQAQNAALKEVVYEWESEPLVPVAWQPFAKQPARAESPRQKKLAPLPETPIRKIDFEK